MQNQAEVTAVEEEESVAKIHIGSAVREIGMKIIFDVFLDKDREIYEEVLKNT